MNQHSASSPEPRGSGELALPMATRRTPIGEYFFAGAAAALGIYVLLTASDIRVPPGSSNVLGPRVFPYAVGVLLVCAAAAVLVSVARGKLGESDDGEDVDPSARTDWLTVAKLSGLFLALVVLIDTAGWPIAVTVLFGGTAWALGAKKWWLAFLVGLGLGLLTQLAFGGLLGLSLPAGPLFDWIPFLHG